MPCPELKPQDAAATTPSKEIDCFRMSKLYDWVKTLTVKTAVVLVPAEDLDKIKEAIANGDMIDITGNIPVDEVKAEVALITPEINSNCACVLLRKNAILHVTVFDSTTATVLSSFTRDIQMFESTKLCFPAGMPRSAIKVKINDTLADSISTSPVDGTIAFNVEVCQDITVELEVLVRLEIQGLCASRAAVPCTNSLVCAVGTPVYPPQCTSACT